MQPVSNPPNPWHSTHVEWIDAPPPAGKMRIYEETATSILSHNSSKDLGFNWSVNPYRGCFHGCAYCYARPTHEYLDMGAGTDFERKIIVKTNAPALLQKAFDKPRWVGERIVMSGNTDCYQPAELHYGITRQLLEICRTYQNPVGIITKSAIIQRDAELLQELHQRASVQVYISLPFDDAKMARWVEPGAPSPKKRLETIRVLADHGIPVGVGVAPVIPGLNDDQFIAILDQAAEAGATSAFRSMVHFPPPVDQIFFARLAEAFPERQGKVLHAIQEMRQGAITNETIGERFEGHGARWKLIADMFDKRCERLGLYHRRATKSDFSQEQRPSTFRRPQEQLSFFSS